MVPLSPALGRRRARRRRADDAVRARSTAPPRRGGRTPSSWWSCWPIVGIRALPGHGQRGRPRARAGPAPRPSSVPPPRAAPRTPVAAVHAAVASPGLREEGDARRKAEDRARAAEERLSRPPGSVPQHARRAADRRAPGPGAGGGGRVPTHACRTSWRDTEQRAREFELRGARAADEAAVLGGGAARAGAARARPRRDGEGERPPRGPQGRAGRSSERERDALVAERDETGGAARVSSRRSWPTGDGRRPQDPELAQRVQQAETEVIGLRAELEGAADAAHHGAPRARDAAGAVASGRRSSRRTWTPRTSRRCTTGRPSR